MLSSAAVCGQSNEPGKILLNTTGFLYASEEYNAAALSVRAAHLLGEKIYLGGELDYSSSRSDASKLKAYGIGPFLRFYTSSAPFRVYMGAELSYVKGESHENRTSFLSEPTEVTAWSYGPDIGFNYMFSSMAGLDLLFHYEVNNYVGATTQTGLAVELGMIFFL